MTRTYEARTSSSRCHLAWIYVNWIIYLDVNWCINMLSTVTMSLLERIMFCIFNEPICKASLNYYRMSGNMCNTHFGWKRWGKYRRRILSVWFTRWQVVHCQLWMCEQKHNYNFPHITCSELARLILGFVGGAGHRQETTAWKWFVSHQDWIISDQTLLLCLFCHLVFRGKEALTGRTLSCSVMVTDTKTIQVSCLDICFASLQRLW